MNRVNAYIELSETLRGWIAGPDARELARVSFELAADPVIVVIGAFLGRSTVLLAGPRKVRGSGRVHCVDPFDCSGDPFSTPIYHDILHTLGGGSLRAHFESNVRNAGLFDWVENSRGARGGGRGEMDRARRSAVSRW